MHKKFITHTLVIISLIGISDIANGQSNSVSVKEMEAGMIVMQVMMNAIGLLTK